jgi:hypothetical protein
VNYWHPHETRGLVEDFNFRPGRHCLNCGEPHRGEDEWCSSCSSPRVPEAPCPCGCLVKKAPHSAYVDYWEPTENDK